MSETNYVKRYDIGNIRLNAPYTHFIYELPLLSFSDVLHTVGLSLVFNSRLSTANSFYISNGYKLSLQKRLILSTGGTPLSYEEGDGTLVTLNNNNNGTYSFDDESQRILRKQGNTFRLDYADFSYEYYDNLGRISYVVDKYGEQYLTYAYTAGKMTSITYRGGKVIELTYSSIGALGSINYKYNGTLVCSSTLGYNGSAHAIVTHYTGVVYYAAYSNGVFTAYSTNSGQSYSNDYSHKITCTHGTDMLTLERFIGSKTVDRTVYNFINYIENDKVNILDITDFQGVKTRVQFIDDKPTYSYEYDSTLFPDSAEEAASFIFKSNISLYKDNEVYGTQTYNSGVRMLYDSNRNRWTKDITDANDESRQEYVIISGWVNMRTNNNVSDDPIVCTITVSDFTFSHNPSFILQDLPLREWVFFSIRVNHNKDSAYGIEAPEVIAQLNQNNQLWTADFKVTPQREKELKEKSFSHITNMENVLINEATDDGNSSDDDVMFAIDSNVVFYNGQTPIEGVAITSNDILKYKINQKFGQYKNEIYYNNCRGIITNAGVFRVGYKPTTDATEIIYNIEDLAVGNKYIRKEIEYVTKTNFYETDSESYYLSTKSFTNDELYKSNDYDDHLDVISTKEETLTTEYERNSKGLIISERIFEGTSATPYIVRYSTYDSTNTSLMTTTDEFGTITSYITNSIWGTVTKTTSNGSSVTDSYDDDSSCLLSKTFEKNSDQKSNIFGYTNGNLSSLSNESLTYGFAYSQGDLSGITKFGATIENHVLSDNDKTLTSYYPAEDNPVYTVVNRTDKYGRLFQIDGVLTNTYAIDPTISSESEENNNGSSKLTTSTDHITNRTTKYEYENDRVHKVTLFDSSEAEIQSEEFVCDDAERLTSDIFTISSDSMVIKSDISYATAIDAPALDKRVSAYSYKINNEQKARTQNAYADIFKRLTLKNITIGGHTYSKALTYYKTRISRVVDTKSGSFFHDVSYGYDSMGRITSEVDSADTDICNTYVYDSFGQLIRENNKALDKTFIYSYNENGTVASVSAYGYTLGDVSDITPTNTDAFTYDATFNDRLTAVNGNSITNNTLGCPAAYSGKSFGWNKGKLSSILEGDLIVGLNETTLSYDAQGRRIKKYYSYREGKILQKDVLISKNTDYTYDFNGRLIKESCVWRYKESSNVTTELIYLYDASGVIGMIYTSNEVSSTYYFDKNIKGDVIRIYDSTGNVVAKYAYDAYGNCKILSATNSTVANANPFRYRSYYYDTDTGFYYLNARYYNPAWRRFISPDSIEYIDPESVNGLNLYAYCKNDPVNYYDPSGHSVVLLVVGLVSSVVVGGLISGGIAMGTASLSGGDIGAAFWGGFVTGALSSLAVGVGMAIGGGFGLLACGGIGFVAGFGGNLLSQSISSYRETGSIKINVGDAIFSGVTNSLVCVATMVGINSCMSDSFSPALSGKTFRSRFVEFMSFDCANTMYSAYFGIAYGLFDGAMSLAKYLVELEISKYNTTNLLVNY